MAENNKEELLIKGIKNDFFIKTGQHIKVAVCSYWEGMANFTHNATIDEIILMIMDKMEWRYEEIYNGSRFPEMIYRRGIIDYIAVHNGELITRCAKKTERDHTTVINSLKKFEERLDTEGYIRQIFAEIVAFCLENYYLYKGKLLSDQ